MPRRPTAKSLRAVFERSATTRDEDIHVRLKPAEAARFRLGAADDNAESLSAWWRKLAHDRCDALHIPR